MRFELWGVVALAGLAAALPHDSKADAKPECDENGNPIKPGSQGHPYDTQTTTSYTESKNPEPKNPAHGGPTIPGVNTVPGGGQLAPKQPESTTPSIMDAFNLIQPAGSQTPGSNDDAHSLSATTVSGSSPSGTQPQPSLSTLPPSQLPLCAPGSYFPYLIQTGDTLTTIANRTFSDVCAIVKANGIPNPDSIKAGATILIPINPGQPADTSCLNVNPSSATCIQSSDASAKNVTGNQYVVTDGQTFTTIAQALAITSDSLQAANAGVKPESLRVGQKINVPVCGTNGSPANPTTPPSQTNPPAPGQTNPSASSPPGTVTPGNYPTYPPVFPPNTGSSSSPQPGGVSPPPTTPGTSTSQSVPPPGQSYSDDDDSKTSY